MTWELDHVVQQDCTQEGCVVGVTFGKGEGSGGVRWFSIWEGSILNCLVTKVVSPVEVCFVLRGPSNASLIRSSYWKLSSEGRL
jgi:hypothetical protein